MPLKTSLYFQTIKTVKIICNEKESDKLTVIWHQTQ